MKSIRVGVMGIGFIGRLHVEALRRIGITDITTASRGGIEAARVKAEEMNIDKYYGCYEDLINDPNIDVIHICTPNTQHYEQAKAALLAGKHVLCEKPLTMTSDQAKELIAIAEEKGRVHGVHFNIRYYPLMVHAKQMVENGEIGKVLAITGSYTQDWLLYETDYHWSVEKENAGNTKVVEDLGSHWFDLMEFIAGIKTKQVFADLATFFPIRKKPTKAVETFSGKLADLEDTVDIEVSTEDYASVLIRFDNDAHGCFTTSQSFAGRKNRCFFEIYGTKKALSWDEERPNELWVGCREEGNTIIMKDPCLLHESARKYASYPGGHNEGFNSATKQLFGDMYDYILSGDYKKGVKPIFPTFEAGLREAVIGEAIFDSHIDNEWKDAT